jgi:hypothetical protein
MGFGEVQWKFTSCGISVYAVVCFRHVRHKLQRKLQVPRSIH